MVKAASQNLVLLGVVTRPHGVRGEVCVKSFCEDAQGLAGFDVLYSPDAKPQTVAITGEARGLITARINNCRTRDEAEQQRGLELYAERQDLPALEDEDNFYHVDLIGLAVCNEQGESLGKISDVANYGAGDFLEIAGGVEEYTVPFTKEAVPTVSLREGKLVVNTEYMLVASMKRGAHD